jgi:hypothetical protein
MVCDRCCEPKTSGRQKVVVSAQVPEKHYYKHDLTFYICDDCYKALKEFIFGEDEE